MVIAGGSYHIALKLAGFAAATVFLVVSALANLRFGLSLGSTELDRAIYAAASVASDVMKAILPILVLLLWSRRHRVTALAAIILWTGCVGWSLASAVGFAATSREDVVAVRQANAETRHGWQTTVRRSEEKLASLQMSRPANVILAEINNLPVPANIWRRTKKCTDVTIETSQIACAKIQSLRAELASARAAEKLEKRLEATRAKLDTAPVSGSKTDPQAAAIAGLFRSTKTLFAMGWRF